MNFEYGHFYIYKSTIAGKDDYILRADRVTDEEAFVVLDYTLYDLETGVLLFANQTGDAALVATGIRREATPAEASKCRIGGLFETKQLLLARKRGDR